MTIWSTELIVSVFDSRHIHHYYKAVHYIYIYVRYSGVKLKYSTMPPNFGKKN